MQSLWKKLFIAMTVFLVISFALDGFLWYQLDATKSQLDITQAQLDSTKAQLETTTARLSTIQPDMDRIEAERDRVITGYASLREQINLRLGLGLNGRSFITPDEPEISAIVQEVTAGYSEEELWKDYGQHYLVYSV